MKSTETIKIPKALTKQEENLFNPNRLKDTKELKSFSNSARESSKDAHCLTNQSTK